MNNQPIRPPTRETVLVFRRAAQILQARGHSKGLYEQPSGEVCAVGALLAAEGHIPADGPAMVAGPSEAVWVLSARVFSNTVDSDPVERIADWNDAPERTATEVVAELLAAARDIEVREAGEVVPVCLRTSDGALWELSSVPSHGDPRYVLAGCASAPESVFAEFGELVDSFGAVDEAWLREARLLEQRHQVFDLDVDSRWPVPASLVGGAA